MKTSWRTELPHWLLLAAMFAGAALSWSVVPDRLPVHWNIAGEVDRYGGKVEAILLLPLVALAMYGLFLVVPRIDPRAENYASFGNVYQLIRLSILAVMAVLYGITLAAARGVDVAVETVVPLVVGGLFVVFGSVMGRLRPNWFVGIRTPWTLSSQLSWDRTHRLGGWLFVLMGAVFVASGLVHAAWIARLAFGLIMASIVVMAAYSYLVWRSDPDRSPLGGRPSTPA